MSGILNRVREGVHEATRPKGAPSTVNANATSANTTTTTSRVPEGTAGPHNSRVANAADPRVDSDLDNRASHVTPGQISPTNDSYGTTSTTHNTRNTNTGSTNAGPHNSNIANKLDPRVDSDLDGSRNMGMNQTTNTAGRNTTTGTYSGSTNAGPHSSNAANKMDPRVDSDLDGSRNAGMNQTTTGTGHIHTGTYGSNTSASHYSGSTNAGPHDSNLANKLDPRVDSDLDGSRNMGMNQTTNNSGRTTTGPTGTYSGSTNAGPHDSNMANKMDPRVDSDLDGSRNAGMNQTTTRTGNTHVPATSGTSQNKTTTSNTIGSGSTNAGPHKSNWMNKLDPRVDSDLDGGKHMGMNQTTDPASGRPMNSANTSGSTNTGPHKSNIANVMDPRVDSDLDGRSNAGMNQTTRTHY